MKKTVFRIALLLTVLAVAFGFAGCGNDNASKVPQNVNAMIEKMTAAGYYAADPETDAIASSIFGSAGMDEFDEDEDDEEESVLELGIAYSDKSEYDALMEFINLSQTQTEMSEADTADLLVKISSMKLPDLMVTFYKDEASAKEYYDAAVESKDESVAEMKESIRTFKEYMEESDETQDEFVMYYKVLIAFMEKVSDYMDQVVIGCDGCCMYIGLPAAVSVFTN